MNTKIVNLKEHSSKEVSLLIQAVLIEMMMIFAVINLISNIFMPVFYVILSMIMFTMAYNNVKFYKKKYMTPIYIIVGVFILVTTFLENVL